MEGETYSRVMSITLKQTSEVRGKTGKTFKLIKTASALGSVHLLLCAGVNRSHVCLHFIYCFTPAQQVSESLTHGMQGTVCMDSERYEKSAFKNILPI